jgi:uncharacterized protein YabN with tetrapyrrole methylase and pyrophosphatase domain
MKPSLVHVCGVGVRVPGHLTVETMGILQGCTRIFSILPPVMRDQLPSPLRDRVENLWTLHNQAELGDWAFDQIIEQIIDAALELSPVAYLAQGNPMLFDPIAQALSSRSQQRGVTIDVRPAVSSIDAILVDLQLNAAPGIQIYETSALIKCGIQPRIDVPCLLVDPCSASAVAFSARSKLRPMTLRSLRDYLRQFYPAEHEVVFVTSATTIGERSRLDRFPLDDLGETVGTISAQNASLYLPAVIQLTVDRQMLDRLFEHGVMANLGRKNGFQA